MFKTFQDVIQGKTLSDVIVQTNTEIQNNYT
jgi:hypothetical protein